MSPHECSGCRAALWPTRRFLIASLACTAAAPLTAPWLAIPAAAQFATDDERFMRMAIEEARQADFPFGAVIVRDGTVLARGRNIGRTKDDPTAHGEMVAIRTFLAVRKSTELHGTTLYTTGEPCAMCMGAILWCRIRPAGVCGVGEATRNANRPDHDLERRDRGDRAVRAYQDHRRRAGRRGDGAVRKVRWCSPSARPA